MHLSVGDSTLQVSTDILSEGLPRLTKLIAFYLPQYQPIRENDEWWGKGFTEWTNVVKAKPLFRGHHQPDLPADLGFYDLRLPEAREAQADLARQYGIHGFCYYHYWFNGRRLLERPFNEVLASGRPGFPFCLCLANEHWPRRWDGAELQILMAQTYSLQDDLNHIRCLLNPFEVDPALIWFGGAVEFQPSWARPSFIQRAWERLLREVSSKGRLNYSELVEQALQAPNPPYRRFRCVTPSWDNTPRRRTTPFVLVGSCPEKYAEWLEAVIRHSQPVAM